jgi:hypothetical protein
LTPFLPLHLLSSRSLLHHANHLVRFSGFISSGSGVQRFDGSSLQDTVDSLLTALPRLVGVEMPDLLSVPAWSHLQPCLAALTGLTALDLSGNVLHVDQARLLVQQLRQLRLLRCRPSHECLQPLSTLPQLTDLGLWAMQLPPRRDAPDVAVVAECPTLRRLTIRVDPDRGCLPMLMAPGLQRLHELTLAHLQCDADELAARIASLPTLRRLTIDRCSGTEAMLHALAVGKNPRLRLLRIGLPFLTDSNAWSHAFRRQFGLSPDPAAISRMLQRRPSVRIELRIGFGKAGVSASWLLPLVSECSDWLTAMPQWTDFALLPRRPWPLLFPDRSIPISVAAPTQIPRRSSGRRSSTWGCGCIADRPARRARPHRGDAMRWALLLLLLLLLPLPLPLREED